MDPFHRGGAEPLPLCKCRVLYIGSALPTEKSEGISALQKPLRERYQVDKEIKGIDSRLLVYNNGVRLEYVEDSNVSIWFPIATLQVCGAVKAHSVYNAGSGKQETEFTPLDSIKNGDSKFAGSPPIFSLISRRNYGIKALECHCFVCKSDQSAMALVECGSLAYETSEEVGMMDDPINDEFMTTGLRDEGPNQAAMWSRDESLRTEAGGYYLANGERLVQNYGLWSNQQQPGPGFYQNHGHGQGTMNRSGMTLPPAAPYNLPPGARVMYIPAKHFNQRSPRALPERIYQDTLRGPPLMDPRSEKKGKKKQKENNQPLGMVNPIFDGLPPPPDREHTPPPDYDLEAQALDRKHDALPVNDSALKQEFLFKNKGSQMYQPAAAQGPSAYDHLKDRNFNEFHEALGYVP